MLMGVISPRPRRNSRQVDNLGGENGARHVLP
jgi:hypothetical protein